MARRTLSRDTGRTLPEKPMRPILAPTAALAVALGLAACAPPPDVTGRALFADFCTGCHGTDARGGGPLAQGLDRPVPDLTLIAARAGGVFPTARVMSVIDGYTRRQEGNVTMPEFGVALQEGPLVLFDTGDGVMTPTPEPLVQLAAYLESLQRASGG